MAERVIASRGFRARGEYIKMSPESQRHVKSVKGGRWEIRKKNR